jgi:hypothetical protein
VFPVRPGPEVDHLVPQRADPDGCQPLGNVDPALVARGVTIAVRRDIVVAENGEYAKRRLDPGQAPHRVRQAAQMPVEDVSCDHDQVRAQLVRSADEMAQLFLPNVRPNVQVGELPCFFYP